MTEKDNTGSIRITNKQIWEQLNEINKTLSLHNQRLEIHITSETSILKDHEDRIRKIEESVWKSSWTTSVITAVITAIIGTIIITAAGL